MLKDARPKPLFSDSMGRQVHNKERLVTSHNKPTPVWTLFVGWVAGKGHVMPHMERDQHKLTPHMDGGMCVRLLCLWHWHRGQGGGGGGEHKTAKILLTRDYGALNVIRHLHTNFQHIGDTKSQ